MAFRTIEGFEGRVFTPDIVPDSQKKYDCEDCLSCQMCSDERCELCLRTKCCTAGADDRKIAGRS